MRLSSRKKMKIVLTLGEKNVYDRASGLKVILLWSNNYGVVTYAYSSLNQR